MCPAAILVAWSILREAHARHAADHSVLIGLGPSGLFSADGPFQNLSDKHVEPWPSFPEFLRLGEPLAYKLIPGIPLVTVGLLFRNVILKVLVFQPPTISPLEPEIRLGPKLIAARVFFLCGSFHLRLIVVGSVFYLFQDREGANVVAEPRGNPEDAD